MSKLARILFLLGLTGLLASSQVQRSGSSKPSPLLGRPGSVIGSVDELKQYAAGGHILGFRKGEMFVASGDHALRVEFVNAGPVSPVEEAKSGDPESGHSAAQPLGKIAYPNLWDGVTLVYENHSAGVVKSTYHVEPVGDSISSPLSQIRLRYNVPVKVDDGGSLVFSFSTGEMRESRPVAWQEIGGKRIPVEANYRLISEQEIGFKARAYDPRYPLVIDPVLSWNTFLGSSADTDQGYGIAMDTSGNVYVTGYSWVTWGSPVRPHSGSAEAFVAKLNGSGALQWNTFLGGSGVDRGYGIAVDGNGNIYVTGESNATWGSPVGVYSGGVDAFAAKLNNSGILQWNTFLGSTQDDFGYGIALDTSGNVYVTGYSLASWGSPVRLYAGGADAFAAKLDNDGVLQWNSFLGSTADDRGQAIATYGSANIYVTGYSKATWGSPIRSFVPAQNAFIAKLDGSGTLQWNTFLGGGWDIGYGIALDINGNVYVGGVSGGTWGSPVRPISGGIDAFVAKVSASGDLQWNTFLGSTSDDYGYSIAVDTSGNIYAAGYSNATWGSPARPFAGGLDAFAAKLDANGALKWNAFLGGSDYDYGYSIAVDTSGNVYVAGTSFATWGSPVRPFSGGEDAFVAKISPAQKDDLLGTWTGQGVYYRNSDTGAWVLLATPATKIVEGDLDGDGIDDLIGIWPSQGGVWVKYSQSGAWALLSSTADWIAAGDMNGDGKAELLGSWAGQGVFWRNNSTGLWTQLATPATKVVAGDLDGDGIDDLIGIWPSQGGVWVKYSQSGSWALLSSTADWIAAGDMNGDGRDDLLGAWTGQGVYYRNSMTGQWVLMASPATMVTAGDLDGDGIDDLIGIWPSQGGVWAKYSQSGAWALLSSTADWIAAGKMRAANGQALSAVEELALPMGGLAVGPPRTGSYKDLSANSPGRESFTPIIEKNLIPVETRTSQIIPTRIPGPGEPGFRCIQQKDLFPEAKLPEEKSRKKSGLDK